MISSLLLLLREMPGLPCKTTTTTTREVRVGTSGHDKGAHDGR